MESPLPCPNCIGAGHVAEFRGDAATPSADGTDYRRGAGALCDRCGETGLDPDTLLRPISEYAKSAVRWTLFEAPADWTVAQCRDRIGDLYGSLTMQELQARMVRSQKVDAQTLEGLIHYRAEMEQQIQNLMLYVMQRNDGPAESALRRLRQTFESLCHQLPEGAQRF